MSFKKYFFFLFFSVPFHFGFCQTDEPKEKIATILENYFDLEREAIHLHLDKSTFITNESIWYQGYTINRKTNKPYFTTNVFMVLYDENGKLISEKLQYANNGIFCGKIDLNPKLKSGDYYIQTYTNWMNNFSENESTLTKITIINPAQGIKNYSKINLESLEIKITPEGNSFIEGISNQVGIQMNDCRGNTSENMELSLRNESDETLKKIKLNKFGFGKFEIIPTKEKLSLSVDYLGKTIKKQLPVADEIGYSIDVNNFTSEDKTIIRIKSNQATVTAKQKSKLFLVIHQDQKLNLYDIELDPVTFEKVIVLNNSNLFEGITTLRIIDNNLKQWCERQVYVSPKKSNSFSITKTKNNHGKINLAGNSSFQNAFMSVAVLPEESKSGNSNSIIAGLLMNPYLETPVTNTNYYFSNFGRLQRYELDLFLLNQEKSKYDWETIKTSPPKANYTFDIGITLKGTIDEDIKNKTFHKAKLVSFKDFIMMQSDINEKGEYSFDHILLADSTYISLSLVKLPNFDVVKTQIRPQVIGRKRPFNKPFKPSMTACNDSVDFDYITDFDMPKLSSGIIKLNEVKVETKKKKLTYENRLGNGSLRAFKIDDRTHFRDILQFIEANGFTVRRNKGDVQIFTRRMGAINNSQTTPEVYIDERKLLSYDELDMMSSDEVDEVYLDPNAIIASMNNNQGIIKIYRKKGVPGNYKERPDPNSFYIKEGFCRYFGFANMNYSSTVGVGFENFGIINWVPTVKSDENGQFRVNVENYNIKTAKVIVEGISSEGELLHEEKIIDLK